ncbi:MAG: carbamoyl phosphate synthase small subunit [Clostridiaceae bacterium]|nr:carbamoyl phosphate synthase small subunit [Clostridiaceae bacterium]
MKAILILEDGTKFTGEAFGAEGTFIGEVVFNTGMTGYQEIITDPSSYGQILTMTYPLIGNYGINEEDTLSSKPHINGLIVRELCTETSSWRATGTLDSYLKKYNIPGLQGIDTRALTSILREKGAMKGLLTTDSNLTEDVLFEKISNHCIKHPAYEVTCDKVMHYKGNSYRMALVDYGSSNNIINLLRSKDCDIYVFPASAKAEDILDINPDGIVLSNGPGNPKEYEYQIQVIKKLLGKKPIFGISLGHQLVALALGSDTEKLKNGHRGQNHPVKDLVKDRTYITVQNHGYIVKKESLQPDKAVISHINLNDNTIEGIRYSNIPAITVQFCPEALYGPINTGYIFEEFITMVDKYRNN